MVYSVQTRNSNGNKFLANIEKKQAIFPISFVRMKLPPSLSQLLGNDKPGISSEVTRQRRELIRQAGCAGVMCEPSLCIRTPATRGRRLALNDFRRNMKVGLKCLKDRNNDIVCAQCEIYKIKKSYLVSRDQTFGELCMLFCAKDHNREGVN